MKDCRKFYINGSWVAPKTARDHQVINPSTEEPCGTISLGAKADVDDAVAAARRAFATFSQTTREETGRVPSRSPGRIACSIRSCNGPPSSSRESRRSRADSPRLTGTRGRASVEARRLEARTRRALALGRCPGDV